MTNPVDRRAHPRHDLTISVTFRNDGTAATTRDLSIGGCAILAPRIRLQNERIQIGLLQAHAGLDVEVVGEVRRAVPMPDGKYLLGIQFVEISDDARAKLNAFIESQKPKTDEASVLLAQATDAEHAGKVQEAIKLLERALTVDPKRGDILVTRARLASQVSDHKGAANFARRAAEAEPANQQFAQLYQRYTEAAPAEKSPAPQNPATEPVLEAHRRPPKSFLPRDTRSRALAAIGALVFVVLIAGNLWFWLLRPAPDGPEWLDPGEFSDLVPMSELAIRDGRAYGTVDASWASLADREKRVGDLAARLGKEKGAGAVYLTGADNKLVATYRDGNTRLFK